MKKTLASSAAAVALLITSPSAHAAYVVDVTQVGPDVVAKGSGTLDLTDLNFFTSTNQQSLMAPSPSGTIITGPATPVTIDALFPITGPVSFGPGAGDFASSGSGDQVGVVGSTGDLLVPLGYVSGDALSDTATYSGETFASLGATPGTYEWTWGTGTHADSFTLQIGPAGVPEPSTWALMLVGFAGLGFAGWRARGVFRLAA